jgi:hypothetical protein
MTELKPILTKMTDEEVDAIMDEASKALDRGDEGSYFQILLKAPLDPGQADVLKQYKGIKGLIASGFNLSAAVDTYGEEWLYN